MFRLFHLMWVFFSSSNFVPSFLVILFSVWVCSFCLATQHINTLFKTCTEQPFCNQIFWWLSDRQYTFCFHVNIQCANYFTTSSLYLIIVKSTGSISQNWERFRLFLFFPFLFFFFLGGVSIKNKTIIQSFIFHRKYDSWRNYWLFVSQKRRNSFRGRIY